MNKEQFEKLAEGGYDLNMMFLITLPKEQLQTFGSSKIKGWIQTCIRKGLLTEELEITLQGKNLLATYSDTISVTINDTVNPDKFEEWWEIYPSTDYLEYKGKVFEGGRALRLNKTKPINSNCKLQWDKIINSGKYTADDVIRATKFHIDTLKELSYKKNENKLSFLQQSERYLRIGAFIPYIELSKNKQVKNEPNYSSEG